jgi:hypothetical protein
MGLLNRIFVDRFTSGMREAASTLGLHVTATSAQGWKFRVASRGESYGVISLCTDRRNVRVMVFSRYVFPLDQLPDAVCDMLDRMNRGMRKFAYAPYHSDDYSQFTVCASMPIGALSPGVFQAALVEMLPLATALDEILVRESYAR